MAKKSGVSSAVKKVKDYWDDQVNNESNWAANAKLIRAIGLFAGSIVLMRNFGDLMAI